MLRPLKTDKPENLRLSGLVSYTGRTSLEVTIFMESVDNSATKPETILVCLCSLLFLFSIIHHLSWDNFACFLSL